MIYFGIYELLVFQIFTEKFDNKLIYKKIIFVSISLFFASFMHVSCSQELHVNKDTIPISKGSNGIPIYMEEDTYYLEGFEVDLNGDYYFMTGTPENAILVKFNSKNELFRKQYKEFHPSRIHITNDSIILFDYYFERNNLFILNKENGEIKYHRNNILTNRVNSFAYLDDRIILEIFNDQPVIDINTELGYIEMNFSGNIIGSSDHEYGLLGGMSNMPFKINNPELNIPWSLGIWKDCLLFFYIDFVTFDYVFVLYNPNLQSTYSYTLSENFFDKQFYDPWHELLKLRNGIIYAVGHRNNNIIISKLKMDEMFPKVGSSK